MRGNEFIKRVQRLARKQGLEARVEQRRGKGSHVTLYYGAARTVVRNPKDELKTGTFHAMLAQLGIALEDFQDGCNAPIPIPRHADP